jgi:hypothetical protein
MKIFGIYTNLKEFFSEFLESRQRISIETLQEQIPYYLTREAKEGLLKELGNFPKKINYYISRYQDEVLQGDGWDSLDIYNFTVGKKNQLKESFFQIVVIFPLIIHVHSRLILRFHQSLNSITTPIN